MSSLASVHDRLCGATSQGLYDAARQIASLIDQGADEATACTTIFALRPGLFHDAPRLSPKMPKVLPITPSYVDIHRRLTDVKPERLDKVAKEVAALIDDGADEATALRTVKALHQFWFEGNGPRLYPRGQYARH